MQTQQRDNTVQFPATRARRPVVLRDCREPVRVWRIERERAKRNRRKLLGGWTPKGAA